MITEFLYLCLVGVQETISEGVKKWEIDQKRLKQSEKEQLQ